MNAPFQYGTLATKENFVDRVEDRAQLKSFLSSHINVMLISPRRWGKSSLVEALVKSAKREIVLIDNYIDASIFDLLEKREQGVDATIYTEHVGQSLTHLQQLNQQQYGRRIEVKEYNSRFHDRFLILDDALYHFGASFKDLGKRLFAFELMGIDKNIILNQL